MTVNINGLRATVRTIDLLGVEFVELKVIDPTPTTGEILFENNRLYCKPHVIEDLIDEGILTIEEDE